MKKAWSFIILFVCLLSGCGCEEEVSRTTIVSSYVKAYLSKDSEKFSLVEPFGTYISIVGYKEKRVNAVESKFNELVSKYHSLLDRHYYYKDSEGNLINNIRVINDSYGSEEAIVVDDIIIDILKEGIKYTKLSNGKFNIFAGSLVDLWDERFSGTLYGVDPSEEEVNNALNCVIKVSDIDSTFIIDEENKTVTFNSIEGCNTKASITLGALAKSYFLDKIANEEDFKKIGAVIYDAGQSSIIINGKNPTRDEGEWLIAVRDSLNSNYFSTITALQLKITSDNAISTSGGDYKGYINSEGVRRHHIIDATSGYPSTSIIATTVVGNKAMMMDIITTTLMTMNIGEIKTYLANLESEGIKVSVLLQVEENEELVIFANEEMREKISKVSEGIEVREFNYGA